MSIVIEKTRLAGQLDFRCDKNWDRQYFVEKPPTETVSIIQKSDLKTKSQSDIEKNTCENEKKMDVQNCHLV